MESNRLIIVPKNQAGIDKYNRGENDETDSIIFRLSGKEFVTLQRHRVFDILNDRFDLWIDDGESEEISASQLKSAYSAISPVKGEWLKAVDEAIRLKTCMYLVF